MNQIEIFKYLLNKELANMRDLTLSHHGFSPYRVFGRSKTFKKNRRKELKLSHKRSLK